MNVIVPVPNEVLDLHTLKFVREGVLKTKRLCTGSFHKERTTWFGLKVEVDHCALGTVYPHASGNVFSGQFEQWSSENDLDNHTLAEIVLTNDNLYADLFTPEERHSIVLDWLNRCIAYAENVKREIEKLASSTPANVAKELVEA